MTAKTMLLGKAPLTVIRLTDGTRKNVSAGAAVPESILPADAERLVEEGFLEEVELLEVDDVETVTEDVVPFDDGLGDGTPDDAVVYSDEDLDELLAKSETEILDEVDDNATLAAALLARETDGKARKGVSAGLQEVVDNATPAGGQS